MTELERSVLPYLRHRHVTRSKACKCPPDSWAPCGGQYEGRYAENCAEHLGPVEWHAPRGSCRVPVVC